MKAFTTALLLVMATAAAAGPAPPRVTVDEYWAAAVGKFAAAGAKASRQCFPAMGVCETSLSMTNANNSVTMMTVKSDINDRVIARRICSMNPMHDIAKCVPFEQPNAVPVVSMKDSKGNWYEVKDASKVNHANAE